jgi:hypothetical protein
MSHLPTPLLTKEPELEMIDGKRYLVMSFNDSYEIIQNLNGAEKQFRDLYIEEPNFSDMQKVYKISAKLNILATSFEKKQAEAALFLSRKELETLLLLKKSGIYNTYLGAVEEERHKLLQEIKEQNTLDYEDDEATTTPEQQQDQSENNYARNLIAQVFNSANEMDEYFTITNDIINFISKKCYIERGSHLGERQHCNEDGKITPTLCEMPFIEINEMNAFKNVKNCQRRVFSLIFTKNTCFKNLSLI